MRGNPLEILDVESEGGKAEGARNGDAGNEKEAFARSGSEKVVAELESRVKALRAL